MMSVAMLALSATTTVLLAAAAAADLLLRRSTATARSTLWNVAMVCALALPLMGWLLPAWNLPLLRPAEVIEHVSSLDDPGRAGTDSRTAEHHGTELATGGRFLAAVPRARVTPPPSVAAQARPIEALAMSGSRPRDAWPLPLGWLGALWALGSALLLTQLLAGISRVAWIERTATAVVDPGLIARLGGAARRLGVVRPVRLLDAGSLRVPVTWELTTACILVPRQMSGWPIDRQDAVMLHEMAHIRRHDSRFQVLAYLMVALHWFNPLAWYALHRMRAERELACDDAVLMSGVRASDYAAHLLDIARSCKTIRRQLVAAVALVWPSQLAARVRAILDPTIERRSPDWRTSVSIAFAALVLAAPLAAIQPVQALPPTVAEPIASSPTRSGTEPVAGRAAQPAEPTASSPTPAPQAARPSLEQLIQMRIHGVSPEYIEGMHAILGRSPDVNELVQFRIHGVTAELVQEMRDAFGADLEMDDIVQARIHGTSPEYAREMSALLGHDLDLDRLVQFRIHGVTPAYVSAMRDSFGDVSANDLVQGRIHGVSAEFAAAMRELVHGDLDFDDLEQMRIHGVTTDLVKRLRDAGYDDLTAKELVDIRIHGTERMMLRRKGQGR